MISRRPSLSRSATAGEASHDSFHRSLSVTKSEGAVATRVPPPIAGAHDGVGIEASTGVVEESGDGATPVSITVIAPSGVVTGGVLHAVVQTSKRDNARFVMGTKGTPLRSPTRGLAFVQ